MRKKDKKIKAVHEIFQELKSFGRFKKRKGKPIISEVLQDLEEQKILIQSRRENSIYFYPSENYEEAVEIGPVKYLKTSRERSIESFFDQMFDSDRGIFLGGLIIEFILGGAFMYLILEKLLF